MSSHSRAQEIVLPQGMMGSADSSRTHHALVLLRHKTSSAGRSSSTARTSWQAACEGIDQSFAHGCDRVWDVTLRAQGQILWVDDERVLQAAGTAGPDVVLRGGTAPPWRIGNRKRPCTT